MAAPNATKHKLLIAIDYGTTFSGVAWTQTARPKNQTVISQWPGIEGSAEGITSEKVPTKLFFEDDKANPNWGFQVSDFEEHFKEFKLYLNSVQATDSTVAKDYPDTYGLRPHGQFSAKRLTTDYLRKLREHSVGIIKLKLGDAVVDTTPIEWVLTVPAIWTESAKGFTLQCAKEAGLHGKISLVSEPEAAITYALDSMDSDTLVKGDTVVMCDAGGGTVDLISYVISEVEPLSISEVVVGDGHKAGSAYVNRVFASHIEEKLSDLPGWDRDTFDDAMERFETVTKRSFTGNESQLLIPVTGLSDSKADGVKRGKYTVPGSTMRSIFDPVVNTVTTLVQDQIKQTTGKVSAILLVGGFGQNPYLRGKIKQTIGDDIKVLQPQKGWTAVVEGALLKALSFQDPAKAKVQIKSRKARKCYGITASIPFINGKHQKRRKFLDECHGIYRIEIVDWIVKKGEELSERTPITLKYFQKWRKDNPDGAFFSVDIVCFESETGRAPPQYQDQGARKLTVLNVDLTSIPTRRLQTQPGSDGRLWYYVNVEVQCKFESAGIEYSLWYEGKCYGSVDAKYE